MASTKKFLKGQWKLTDQAQLHTAKEAAHRQLHAMAVRQGWQPLSPLMGTKIEHNASPVLTGGIWVDMPPTETLISTIGITVGDLL